MRNVVLLMLLCAGSLAGSWPTERGPLEGTRLAEGVGGLTGVAGGYPTLAWSTLRGGEGNTDDASVVADLIGADGFPGQDGVPEIIAIVQGRAVLFDSSGTVLAASDAISSRYLQGLYEFDGDSSTRELVLTSSVVGGGATRALDLRLPWRLPRRAPYGAVGARTAW